MRIKTKILYVIVFVLLNCFAIGEVGLDLEIERILRTNANNHRVTHATDLEQYGDSALEPLSTFLRSDELGFYAALVMVEIDYQRAGPVVFTSMPESDRNVQYQTFKRFIRLIEEGKPVECMSDMHDAAIRCLEANTNADAGEQAIYAIGLTGSTSDFPLLEGLCANSHRTPFWRTKLSDAAEAALARLGHEKYLKNIYEQLDVAVPSIIIEEKASTLCAFIDKAAFSGNKGFIPVLCKHIRDPNPVSNGDDVIPRSPSYCATKAMYQIINGRISEKSLNMEEWIGWCDQNTLHNNTVDSTPVSAPH